MYLYLFRHGKAENRSLYASLGKMEDDLRPLTQEGMDQVTQVVKGVKGVLALPTHVYVSPLVRAKQTVMAASEVWDLPNAIETDTLIPSAQPSRFFDLLRERTWRDDDVVLAVGHEPNMSALVSWGISESLRSQVDFKKAGVASLVFVSQPKAGAGWLQLLLSPKCIRKLKSS